MNIKYRHQKRKSLAFKLTAEGGIVLVPYALDSDSQQVKDFIAEALRRLPNQYDEATVLPPQYIHQLVEDWQDRLKVKVTRLQIRSMKRKWGSLSTAGTLTLAEELLTLPYDLAEYVIVHELLHLQFPDHRKGWQVSMGMYLPNWHECEQRLQHYIFQQNI